MQTPTEHPTAVGPQEAPTAAQGRTSRVHRPQGGGGRTPRDHRRSGRDSTELRPQTWVFGPGGGRGGVGGRGDEEGRGGARRLFFGIWSQGSRSDSFRNRQVYSKRARLVCSELATKLLISNIGKQGCRPVSSARPPFLDRAGQEQPLGGRRATWLPPPTQARAPRSPSAISPRGRSGDRLERAAGPCASPRG